MAKDLKIIVHPKLRPLERFWLAIGLLIFRVEGFPVEHRITNSKNESAFSKEDATPQINVPNPS